MIPTDLVIMQFDVKKRIIYPFNLTKHRPINTLPKAKASKSSKRGNSIVLDNQIVTGFKLEGVRLVRNVQGPIGAP